MATDHRKLAEELLERSKGYAPASPARMIALAEAQIHATLALSQSITITQNITPKTAPRPRKAASAKEPSE